MYPFSVPRCGLAVKKEASKVQTHGMFAPYPRPPSKKKRKKEKKREQPPPPLPPEKEEDKKDTNKTTTTIKNKQTKTTPTCSSLRHQ